LQAIMSETRRQMEHSVPFAMEPVVYDFAINEQGTQAALIRGDDALMPAAYYELVLPSLIRMESRLLSRARRAELERFTSARQDVQEFQGMVQVVFEHLTPRSTQRAERVQSLEALLEAHGFDRVEHEHIQADLRRNNATYWIDLDSLLAVFGLTRSDLTNTELLNSAIRSQATRMPTYITLKDVKKRWGKGQEGVFPVAQFEKLWGDMTALPELKCRFVVVARARGQQLKEPAQLGWFRDGSAAYVESLCDWTSPGSP
jgi:hypothetical protein